MIKTACAIMNTVTCHRAHNFADPCLNLLEYIIEEKNSGLPLNPPYVIEERNSGPSTKSLLYDRGEE